jgi:hypothetical protein
MIQNYKVITLCGSTRFKEQFLEVQKRLTLEGCIVISVGLFGHSGDEEVWKPGVLWNADFLTHSKTGRLQENGKNYILCGQPELSCSIQ